MIHLIEYTRGAQSLSTIIRIAILETNRTTEQLSYGRNLRLSKITNNLPIQSYGGSTRGACVYEIHISPPYKHAGHYIGWTKHLSQRFAHHCAGNGSKLTHAAVQAGCALTLVRVWRGGDRILERKFHRYKNGKILCPICSPNAHRGIIKKEKK